MSWFKIIMAVCFLPVILILYVVMRNETKAKKNLILGVTLPYAQRESAEVLDLCRRYRRTLALVSALLTVLVVPGLLLRHTSVVMTYLLAWLTAVLIAIPAVFVRYRRVLLGVKRAYLGDGGERVTVRAVDTRIVGLVTRKIHGAWFIPPAILGAVPVRFALQSGGAGAALIAGGTGVLMVALFYFIYRVIFRQRAEIVDDNSGLTAALTRVRRQNYGLFCVGSAWLTGLFNLVFWIRSNGLLAILATGIYTLLLIALALYAEMKTRQSQGRLTKESGQGLYIDEDEHWLGGLLYYNPGDRKLMVNDRTGMGMTMNMARPAGMVLTALSALILLTMPLWGVWMMAEEFTPPTLRLEVGVLTVVHTREFAVLPVSEMESAEYLETLPPMTRINGTGMDTVLKGRFRAEGLGDCRLCLDPARPPFILIRSGGGTYIFSGRNPAITGAVYGELVSAGVAG